VARCVPRQWRRWRLFRDVVGGGVLGCWGAWVLGCWGAGVLSLIAACSYMPGEREMQRAEQALLTVDGVVGVHFTCPGSLLASDSLCTDVVMKDGAQLRFDRVGFNSFGSTAMNVIVGKAGGLVPRIASCTGVSAPNFHRTSPLGHHFHPTLIDVKDAVFRYREVLEEVEFWPQCPQYWEVQDRRGENFRYCSRREGATDEPPRPANCR
jgi:hypothetical protein